MTWYRDRYGWSENPFNVRPDPENYVGYDELRQEVLQYVGSGDLFLVYGRIGSGKTTLFRWIQSSENHIFNMFPGKYVHRIEYFDASNLTRDDVEKFCETSRLSRFLHFVQSRDEIGPRKIMLVDEAQELDRDVSKLIKSKYDSGDLWSVGLASLTDQLDVSDSFLDRVGVRQVKMRKMKMREAKKMIQERLGSRENPFSEEVIETIIERSNYSPRKILETIEYIAMNTNPPVEKQDLQDLLDEKQVKEHESEDLTSTELLEKVTPSQAEILLEIKKQKEMSAPDLHEEGIGGSTGSVRKQLSRLSDLDKLEERGIYLRLVEKVDESSTPYKWKLTKNATRIMAED